MFSLPIDIFKGSIYTLIIGVVLTWIFDIPSQLFSKNKNILTKGLFGIIDFLYIILGVTFGVLVIYYFNSGIFRGIFLLSFLLGLYVYYKVFSRILMKISRILLAPIVILCKFIRKIYLFLFHSLEKIIYKLYNKFKSRKLYFTKKGKVE